MNKEHTTLVLALTLSLLCTGLATAGCARRAGATSDPDFSRRCVEALAELAKSAGVTASSEGDRLRIGKDELRIGARPDNEGQAHSQHFVGMVVDVSINGVAQPLTAGVVGVGATREEALAAAVTSWVQPVGVALLDALGVKGRGKPVLSAGRFSVYAGKAGISSTRDIAWSDESRRQLLDTLSEVVRGLESSPSEFHLILMMAGVGPGGAISGECRVDGVVSGEALKAAKSFPWPQAEGPYMVKQYYLLRRRP